jgi:2'-hydroxyisoflavone reductase
MKTLIIGGSSFVGRAITLAALEAGHEVTVFNRGATATDLPIDVQRLVGDRRLDLSALDGHSFDATIDAIAYQRRDVELLHDALGARGGHYLQISSISAYEEPAAVGADESTPLRQLGDGNPNAVVNNETYGVLKAECERAAEERFGSDIAIVRPTYVIGGHDKTMRFPYWVARMQRGGRVAFPGPRANALQWIDARDLGAFVVALSERRYAGAVNANGPVVPFGEVLSRVAAHVAPEGTTLTEIDADRVTQMGLTGKFPLWTGSLSETMLAMSNEKARSLGLTLRSLEESIDDTVAWFADRTWPEQWLTSEEEQRLLG